MRRTITLALLSVAALAGLARSGVEAPQVARAATPIPALTTIRGVSWHTDLAAARARAQREHKPLLLLQMFGRLDEEMC